jgi:hypothetical protein
VSRHPPRIGKKLSRPARSLHRTLESALLGRNHAPTYSRIGTEPEHIAHRPLGGVHHDGVPLSNRDGQLVQIRTVHGGIVHLDDLEGVLIDRQAQED